MSKPTTKRFGPRTTTQSLPHIKHVTFEVPGEGEVQCFHIDQCMGSLTVIRSYDGENVHSLHVTGGHYLCAGVTCQEVDDEVKHTTLSSFDKQKTFSQILEAFIKLLPERIQHTTRQYLVEACK